ncbi:MAG: lambda exonuclease family protein [Smithella sp.]|jgi:putative phage-type endonuclease
MPIIIDCEQRSEDWFKAICGNVGASSIDKIITSKGEPSKSRSDYMMTLAAERITGKQEVGYLTQAMINGIEREAEARSLFEMAHGVEIKQVGLVYKDDRKLCHCSPDGLIDDNAGIEIKNPISKTHVKYLLDGKLPTEYFCQVQFSLYISEREIWWFMSHYPGLKPLIVEVYRDEKWIAKMEPELNAFNEQLDEMVRQLQ